MGGTEVNVDNTTEKQLDNKEQTVKVWVCISFLHLKSHWSSAG